MISIGAASMALSLAETQTPTPTHYRKQQQRRRHPNARIVARHYAMWYPCAGLVERVSSSRGGVRVNDGLFHLGFRVHVVQVDHGHQLRRFLLVLPRFLSGQLQLGLLWRRGAAVDTSDDDSANVVADANVAANAR